MSPTTKAILRCTLILGGLTIVLLLVVVGQLHSYTQSGAGGWNLAFNILTARASPFGTRAGVWAVILAVWGAVAALILGEYLSGSMAALDRAIDIRNRRITKKLEAAQQKLATAKTAKEVKQAEEQVKQAEAEAEKAEAGRAEAEAKKVLSQAATTGAQTSGTSPAAPIRDERGHE
jgi:hypothetical protein